MKVFLFRFNTISHIEAARELKRRGVDILYWSASKHDFETLATENDEFPGTVFHTTFDATLAKPAPGVNTDEFPPLDEQFILDMLPYESQVLTMMNAIDYSRIPTIEKKRIYYEYIKYWHGVLTRMKPDALLFGDIPHIAYQFVAYRIAQKLGIKTVMGRVLQITGRELFMTNHETYPEVLEAVRQLGTGHKTVDDLHPDVRAYYEKQLNPHVDASPFYMKKKYTGGLTKSSRILPSVGTIWKHVMNGTLVSTTASYIKGFTSERKLASLDGIVFSGFTLKRKMKEWKKIRESFQAEYVRLAKPVDWSKKFIYVALHNQPECSTSAMGGVFVDQHLMIDQLAAALPEGWVLYVKESPVQWIGPRAHLGRYPGFYEEIACKKNVQIVPTGTSTFELIKHAQAVATVTGTAGWEALLRGKPALVFGYIFYMYCDGVFRIHDLASAKAALQAIQNGAVPNKQKVLDYLWVMDQVSTAGYPNKRFKGTLDVTDEQNGINFAHAYLRLLQAQPSS